MNAGGLPDDLLEAELFGAEAGAYTGANKLRIGRFEAADGGTLFLDEIGNLPLAGAGQAAARAADGRVRAPRLERRPARSTCAIISATNADLPRAIAAGAFREDLYFRLNVIELLRAAARPIAPTTSCRWPSTSWRTFAGRGRAPAARCRDEARAALLAATTGRATCASCRTASSAPS